MRASGDKALHDEELLDAKEVEAARKAGSGRRRPLMGSDRYAFTLAFKAVVLEGLEVAFIVVTFGANARNVPLAALAAAAAIVAIVGVAMPSGGTSSSAMT